MCVNLQSCGQKNVLKEQLYVWFCINLTFGIFQACLQLQINSGLGLVFLGLGWFQDSSGLPIYISDVDFECFAYIGKPWSITIIVKKRKDKKNASKKISVNCI